ncbi:type I methionyl aminopeptidase [Actinobacteria bacterium YIM 96077]|uniref:Methionine aminopeptidase n=1 Tax=Phytoactinopolyspora halophila TaxID=1981511 RepID=A0A329R415_9ACTN|nr:type I methionyl aminopeptidase [Phytoactinopolyspora halophila]AYY12040.1 type I methionyl aminopeptidase [Actinobacteria bacterium YIM 96077]RAW18726.1 type I methionyl aminopeptidase [Phytoactinopolyspora halophila]
MVELKTPAEIDAMAEAGKIVAAVHAEVRAHATIGVSLLELDEVARQMIDAAGATSSFLGYQPTFAASPYPAVLNTSVNDVMLHGIPTDYRLRDGDVLSVDFGAHIDGWHADAAVTYIVGTPDPEDEKLIEMTERMLRAGINAAQPGGRMGDISHAMSVIGRAAGYGIQTDFGGHGIGRAMHEEPFVPNEGAPGRGWPLRPGLVIAIEPSLMAGGDDTYLVAPDGWSLCTGDGSRGAHAEHTVAITEDGPRILTAPEPGIPGTTDWGSGP